MPQWLLSGHNPRETFGVSHPISDCYFRDEAIGAQIEHILVSLAGDPGLFDLSMPLLLSVQSRMYLNVTYFVQNAAQLFPFDPTSIGVPADLEEVEALVATQPSPRLSTRLLLGPRFLALYRRTMGAMRQQVPRYREMLSSLYWRLRECDPDRITSEDLAQIDHLFEPSTLEDMIAFMRMVVLTGFLNIGVIDWVNQRAPSLLNLLVGESTSTALLAERMWELCHVAMSCGDEVAGLLRIGETDLARYRAVPEATPLLEALDHFMRLYGHRAFHYASQFEATRLADQPELVLLTIGGLLEEEEPPSVRAQAARQVSQQALQDMNPFRRLMWSMLLKWGSKLIERREEGRDVFELQAASYGLAARLLSHHHFPGQPGDTLFYYRFKEFLDFGRSRGRQQVDPQEIERRRAQLEEHRRAPDPPELIWYEPESGAWHAVLEEQDRDFPLNGRFQGIAASAGSGPVEGVALVTNDAQEAAERLLRMTGPVVLVTHVTDPVWSSLFRRLTAIVTEMGGVMSHAAVVARENGIPSVVGVPEVLHHIRDGQRVRVDGAAGVVQILGQSTGP